MERIRQELRKSLKEILLCRFCGKECCKNCVCYIIEDITEEDEKFRDEFEKEFGKDHTHRIIRFEKVTEVDDEDDGYGVIYNMCPDCLKKSDPESDNDSESTDWI